MEDNIDINLLLKYFRCETTGEEDKAVGRFVADDPDGSHAKAYKEARIIFETLEVNAAAAEKFGRTAGRKKIKPLLIIGYAVSVAAAIVMAVLAGARMTERSFSSEYRTYSVPAGKTMQMTLEDGTQLWLNGGSEVEIPVAFARRTREMELRGGEVYLKVEPDASRPFVVDTYAGKVEVLGTEFNLEVDRNNDYFSTYLVKGSVKVTDKSASEDTYYLEPNDILCWSNGVWSKSVMDNPESVTCWMDGLIDIANIPFEKLMDKFENAFDVDVIIMRQDLPQFKFTRGKLRISDGVEAALKVLKMSSDFEYEIDRNTDTIYIR